MFKLEISEMQAIFPLGNTELLAIVAQRQASGCS